MKEEQCAQRIFEQCPIISLDRKVGYREENYREDFLTIPGPTTHLTRQGQYLHTTGCLQEEELLSELIGFDWQRIRESSFHSRGQTRTFQKKKKKKYYQLSVKEPTRKKKSKDIRRKYLTVLGNYGKLFSKKKEKLWTAIMCTHTPKQRDIRKQLFTNVVNVKNVKVSSQRCNQEN